MVQSSRIRRQTASSKKRLKYKWLIGIDEVGRGPLAGPVGLAICAIPFHKTVKGSYKKILSQYKKDLKLAKLVYMPGKDSKKLTAAEREKWHSFLDIHFGKLGNCLYASKSAGDIDKQGISKCIKLSIEKILSKFCQVKNVSPDECFILLDGALKAPERFVNQQTIIKGDEKEMVISFASIFAKVMRDTYMKNISKKYKELVQYGFEIHKGYGTKGHRKILLEKGASCLHRQTFLRK